MKKLSLKVENLLVESFVTSGMRRTRGTVAGHGGGDFPDMQDDVVRTILECPTLANGCGTIGCFNTGMCESRYCPTNGGGSCDAAWTNYQCLSHDGTCNEWECGSGTC